MNPIDLPQPQGVRGVLVKAHYTDLSHEERMDRLNTFLDQQNRVKTLPSRDPWDLPDSSLWLELVEVYGDSARVAELLRADMAKALSLFKPEIRVAADGTNLKCTCGKADCHSLQLSAGDVLYRVSYSDADKLERLVKP